MDWDSTLRLRDSFAVKEQTLTHFVADVKKAFPLR